MKNNLLLWGVAGFIGYILYQKYMTPAPILIAAATSVPVIGPVDAPSNSNPTNSQMMLSGLPGGGMN